MLRKITVTTAAIAILTFGGAFSSPADAESAPQQSPYKIHYTINGESGSLTKEDASNLLKKALDRVQSKYLTNFDWKQIEKLVTLEKKEIEKKEEAEKAPAKEAEQRKEEVKQPEQKQEQPVEKKEEVSKPQEKAPVQAEPETPEAPAAAPQPQPEQPQQAQQPAEEAGQQSELSEFEAEVVELTNAERAKQGLAPLQIDTELSKVARDKSKDMATNGYFDHNSPVHGSPFDMMKSYGINYSTAGENIAKGQRSPEEVVNGWMNSPGHRANIMNGNFTHIGVGFVEQGNHWTQMFIGK
ncbi:CAP domain-containing protein [Oceanobacillus alkalisoli]|uniref:CAP domain-containing protein n=1 Tax=Oceanobacillus alkalisoli TaxID=2925113 RepID=UPI001EF1249D|nr:CAP domain-containing protein [Oceanobacillus alkalisoli]MCF3943639.1 CAP domain-containing protein [Oceanobacillus alkalisoli]MCG5104964.1 CAP domain-containing protein [Oceanobacillus alkalisoli]